MVSNSFIIDPDAKLDYAVDWSDWTEEEEVLSSSSWEIEPSGPVLSDQARGKKSAEVYVEGCTEGQTYRLTNRIQTGEGREDDRTLLLRCTER